MDETKEIVVEVAGVDSKDYHLVAALDRAAKATFGPWLVSTLHDSKNTIISESIPTGERNKCIQASSSFSVTALRDLGIQRHFHASLNKQQNEQQIPDQQTNDASEHDLDLDQFVNLTVEECTNNFQIFSPHCNVVFGK